MNTEYIFCFFHKTDYTDFMNLNQAFELLKKAGGANAARITLCEILAVSNQQSADSKTRLNFSQSLKIFFAAYQLRRGTPVAKIIGKKWFYGLEFYTNKYTLDPRPDSETLVEAVMCPPRGRGAVAAPPATGGGVSILDLGTGTGCLICAIVKNLPGATGVGVDISRGAIRVARRNVKNLGLTGKVKIERGNFNKLSHKNLFDIIISNPPYIALGDGRVNNGAMHDPALALYAGADGLDAYRAIAKSAHGALTPTGRIYLEIGAGQGDAVREIFAGEGWEFVTSYNDLSGIERVLEFI
jgi:release factor glutamine methyltransferase